MEKDPAAATEGVIEMAAEQATPGMHLLLDFWGCRNMQDIDGIEIALRRAAEACRATVISVQLHSFGAAAGVTGVAILAESHISIHTWPETGYVALDIFVCGNCDAARGADVLADYFQPQRQETTACRRGKTPAALPAQPRNLANNP
ncbi:MAG: adenosylmethionine decarboxylase [Micavibrio sp.]|nr:adenosylmethionine decarboxylase [Micavibrio sp.]